MNRLHPVARLAAMARPDEGQSSPAGPRLSVTELKKIEDFIEAKLDASIATSELAALTGRSAADFLRSLRATTAQTPYQYVLSLRIALAHGLLGAGDMPLADVAYACGFASQSHMTDVFRHKLGITPGRYRREVRR